MPPKRLKLSALSKRTGPALLSEPSAPTLPTSLEALEAIPLPVWLYDPVANAHRWGNSAALTLWDVKNLSELRGKDLSDTRGTTRQRIQRLLGRLSHERQVTETWTLYPNGIPQTLQCTGWLVRYQDVDCIAFMVLPERDGPGDNAILQRDAALEAIARSGGRMLSGGNLYVERNRLLADIGEAIGVDRSYYFRLNTRSEAGDRWVASQEFEWCKPGIPSEIENSNLQDIDLARAGFQRWIDRLSEGLPIVAAGPEQIPQSEWAVLAPQGIIAVCIHPVIVDNRVSGFVGFDITHHQRSESFAGWTSPVVDALAMAAHLIGAALKMSDTQDRLNRTAEEAKEASAVKSRFLANMSHELRTPLNAIIGFAQVLDRQYFGEINESRYREYINHILVSGEHLLSLINDILDLEKARSGQVALNEETLDFPRDVILPAVRLVQQKAVAGQIALDADPAMGSLVLRGDARKLVQLLSNLLTNAIKFTEPGGQVVVRTSKVDAGDVLIEIIDSGEGMTETDAIEAMTPFTQVSRSRHRTHEGTGLGLPLCRQYAVLHGGQMDIQSSPGEGTTVSVRLPACRVVENSENI